MGIGNKKNKNIMLLIVLLLIVLVCFSLWYLRNFYSVNFVQIVRVEAKNGVCDLSGIDFSSSLVQLQSELEYIPGLLTPDEFAAREGEAVTGSYWELPAATSRVILKMPDNATYLATGNSVDYAHRAYFNGELRHQAGVPAETESRMETETLQRLNQAKEEFLHNLSHELQTPLTVVSGFAQLTAHMMDDSVVDRAAVLDNMRRVDSEAARMERLVTLLLNAAAIEHGSFTLYKEPVDMEELLKTVSQVHFPVLDVGSNTIEVEVPSGLPLVWGDKERLLQVLLNLVSNAVKHTDGGSITLSAARKEGAVMVTVSDTGEGIPPELLPNLFKQYPKNRAAEGNGLGLFITAQIVAAHGGEIKIESIPGSGTSVRFTIPINTGNEKI